MTWTWWALPGLVGAPFALSAAIVVFRTAPHRSINRRLSTVLALEGIWMSSGTFFLVESQTVFMWIAAVGVGALMALPYQYLAFLGAAIDLPLVRPFRSRRALRMLMTLSLVAWSTFVLFPHVFIGELYSPPWATWNFLFTPWGTGVVIIHGASSLFGLVVAVTAFRRARPGSVARDHARWFALAFGVRDIVTAALYLFYPVLRRIPTVGDFAYNELGAFANIVYVALLAYGVLRVQLFDLELKIKFAIRNSTVAAVIAGAFFVGSELLESFIPVEGTLLGLLAAGVIVALLRPVHRFAERLASGLMPGVEDSPEYLDVRKREVYVAALEGALEHGEITERERSILRRLADNLEISGELAASLEREVAAAIA